MKTFLIRTIRFTSVILIAISLLVVSCTGNEHEKVYRGDSVEIIGICYGYLDANILDTDEESISRGNYNLHTDLFLKGYCITIEEGYKSKSC